MTAASTRELVTAAGAASSAVPAFNIISLEHAEGVVSGLERADMPGILQLSERAIAFHGRSADPILAALAHLIAAADVPIALHLDHIQDANLAARLIEGAHEFEASSIMVDFAHLRRDENVARTRELCTHAHHGGLFVEAELGEIGGKDGAHAPGARTDPEDAARFVDETGVDALAVAIGSSHAMTTRDASLDLDLLGRLRERLTVPLVLHGSSGVSEHDLRAAVAGGIRKVNVGTALTVAFTAAIRAALAADTSVTDPRGYLRDARDAVSQVVVDFCRVIGSTDSHERSSK